MGKGESEATRKLLLSLSSATVSGVKTVTDLMDRWLDQHVSISVSTRESYQYAVGRYINPALGKIRIEELSTPIISDAIRTIYMEHSLFAAKHSRTLLRMACKWGTLMSLIERDFTAEVPLPKQRGSRTRAWAPSGDHIERLCELLKVDFEQATRSGPRSPSAWLAAELMRSTGARIGEVCAVRWENVDWDAGTITYADTVVYEEGKNQVRGHLKNSDPYRVSYLPLPMLHLLRQHRQDTGPIVVARGVTKVESLPPAPNWETPATSRSVTTSCRTTGGQKEPEKCWDRGKPPRCRNRGACPTTGAWSQVSTLCAGRVSVCGLDRAAISDVEWAGTRQC